jgi:uncharacterized coiled-coil protein SlyX
VPMNAEDFERRLIDLENKNSYQEVELRDLSAAILEQDVRIERLESILRALREKVKEMAGEGQAPLAVNEIPPHY